MIKKVVILLSGLGVIFAISGALFSISYYSACASTDTEPKENIQETESPAIGLDAFKKIEDQLYYDINTKIVYFYNGPYAARHYPPTPYYASNGFPYRYNPETNSLEEIDDMVN